MNAKKCKALRRAARGATVGMPAVQHVSRWFTRTVRKPGGKAHEYQTEQVRLHPRCTRAVYQAMKREARRAA